MWWQNVILALMGGMLISSGALFSLLLSAGVTSEGPRLLLTGIGFSAGFFFVILSHAVLFTEANVLLPARVLQASRLEHCLRIGKFWVIAAIGNLAGAWAFGHAVHLAAPIDSGALGELLHVTHKKLVFAREGTAGAWFQAMLSGILANWLVGLAAFFAMMGRTIVGKYIPVLLVVTLFVAANFQHSPANAGYFGLLIPTGQGDADWTSALLWNLLPAAIGNVFGAMLLVTLPFWLAFGEHLDSKGR